MLSTLLSRDSMISDCSEMYGVPPSFFRRLDQAVLDKAWLTARNWWG